MRTVDRTQFAAAAFAALLMSLLVLRVSDAALSATTDNPSNSFTVASISLSDTAGGTALFTTSNMTPGQAVNDCITVTYNGVGIDPNVVRVYSDGNMAETDVGDPGDLGDDLTVVIEEGTVVTDCTTFTGTATIFTGTLTTFNATTDYASSTAGTWDPAGDGETQIYRLTVTLDAGAGDDVAGDSITDLGFVWETTA